MNLDPRTIIRRALITEKGAQTREQGKTGNRYLFDVHPGANKIQIAQAVKVVFGVDAVTVRTMSYRGKVRRMGRFAGPRSQWKKAIVTLKPGQTIEVFDEV
jgi:large subunit ribosomal protein L23